MISSKSKIGALSVLALATLAPFAHAAQMAQSNSQYSTQSSVTSPVSARDSKDGSWKFTVAPYLWALSMNGTVQIRGIRAPVNENFSDILSQLNWAGMVWMDARKEKWDIFVNLLYASLSTGASDRYISAHLNNNYGLYSAGLSYELYKKCFCGDSCQPDTPSFSLEPYVGARYTSSNVSLKVNTPFGSIRRSNDKHWTDPIIGARLNFDLTKAWLINLAADIGGTNTTSDYSYNVWGILGYKPQTMMKMTTWYLGYRLLDQHYITGSSSNYYNWNMKLYGPVAGVAFTF